ncbi:MAG: protoporphyrinogen oxidase HemJ [Deltaproteobacteria bacterium]|nr:protoporphyrinogen oxidase HemJ [Deltaproteobacteria bacterium]
MYLWIKAFHLIFVVAWFAGLFYIFRLFVYHVKFQTEPKLAAAYELMERKLLYIIMHPAMLLTIVFGVWLIFLNPALLKQAWFHSKLSGVLVLIAYQIFAGVVRRKFSQGNFFLSERACRIINEVPTLLLIGIVIFAVTKPQL